MSSNLTPPMDLLGKMKSWTSQLTSVGNNSELSETEKKDLMQTITQSAVDAVTKSFSEVSNEVIAEIQAGGARAQRGNVALPHVKKAMVHVEGWAKRSKGVNPGAIMTELLDTLPPLQKAYELIQTDVHLRK